MLFRMATTIKMLALMLIITAVVMLTIISAQCKAVAITNTRNRFNNSKSRITIYHKEASTMSTSMEKTPNQYK